MYAFLLSTAVIFVAELGDKSQLMAMTFAARYRARDVLIGITAATALVHLASVGIAQNRPGTNSAGEVPVVGGVFPAAQWCGKGSAVSLHAVDRLGRDQRRIRQCASGIPSRRWNSR